MSMIRKFPGGIHPKEGKGGKAVTSVQPITVAPVPSRVFIPMAQHIGKPCKPVVAKGDHVKVGQMIGEPDGGMSVAVHASVSGTVAGIQSVALANGTFASAVVIDNDFQDEKAEFVPYANPDAITKQDLCDICRNFGIAGMGGATFPAAIKLNVKDDANVEFLLLNGAECEPYLSADHRVMLEKTENIVKGAKLVKDALGIPTVRIGIEKNKPDAIEAMKAACVGLEGFEVCPLNVRYPQGGEKQLIYALTGRTVPAGGLPLAVGAIVCNVGTCNAIYEAVYEGKPVYERVLTVGGQVNQPANYLARIGTPINELVEASQGLTQDARIVLYGGPMMGQPLSRMDVPVTRGCSGITALEETEVTAKELPCIRCGRCLEACPMCLEPTLIDRLVRKDLFDEAEKAGALNCLECGACTFSCPSKRELTQSCKTAKKIITARKKAAAAKGGK